MIRLYAVAVLGMGKDGLSPPKFDEHPGLAHPDLGLVRDRVSPPC